MSQIIRKVTFDTDGAPSPRILAVGMQGDNNARLIRFAVPELTEGQQVYVNAELGEVKDTIRLYEDDEGLYGWSVEQSLLRSFGNGTVQVKVFDALDPLKPKWQSGQIHISVGASMDVDADVSAQYPTAIEQMEARFQEVEAATKASADAAQNAQTGAENARDAAAVSAEATQTAQTAAEAARDEAATLAENAQNAANAAKNSASKANVSVNNAQSYANRAATHANRAESAREAAEAAKTDLEAARDAAAVSAGAAQTAQTAAEAAKTDLEAARDAAAESAAQAGNHATTANGARNAAQASATAAQNAQTAAETAQANAEDARDVAKNRAADAAASATAAASSAEAAQQAATDAQQIIDDTQVSAAKTWSSNGVLEHLTIQFAESGNPAVCYPVEGSTLGAAVTIAPHQAGEGDPSPDNIRPITVQQEAKVRRCGKNLVRYNLPNTKSGITWEAAADGGIHVYGTATQSAWIVDANNRIMTWLPAGTYSFSGGQDKHVALYVNVVFDDGTQANNIKTTPIIMDKPGNVHLQIMVTNGVSLDETIYPQMELGNTATAYEPYQGEDYPIVLPDGFGGGEVDLAAGTVMQTYNCVTLTGKETVYQVSGTNAGAIIITMPAKASGSQVICSHYPCIVGYARGGIFAEGSRLVIGKTVGSTRTAAEWKTYFAEQLAAGTPVTICYPLAEPVTTAIPAQPIPALAGINTVLTDADGLTVSGCEDPAHTRAALQAQIDELKTAIIAIGGK